MSRHARSARRCVSPSCRYRSSPDAIALIGPSIVPLRERGIPSSSTAGHRRAGHRGCGGARVVSGRAADRVCRNRTDRLGPWAGAAGDDRGRRYRRRHRRWCSIGARSGPRGSPPPSGPRWWATSTSCGAVRRRLGVHPHGGPPQRRRCRARPRPRRLLREAAGHRPRRGAAALVPRSQPHPAFRPSRARPALGAGLPRPPRARRFGHAGAARWRPSSATTSTFRFRAPTPRSGGPMWPRPAVGA